MKCCSILSLDVRSRASLCTTTNKYWDYLNLNCYHIQVGFLFACYAHTIFLCQTRCFDAPHTHTPTLYKANNGRFFLRLRTNPINTDRTTVLCNHERDSCKRRTERQTDRQQERERYANCTELQRMFCLSELGGILLQMFLLIFNAYRCSANS